MQNAGARATNAGWEFLQAQDAAFNGYCRPGRWPLRRHGSAQKFLNDDHARRPASPVARLRLPFLLALLLLGRLAWAVDRRFGPNPVEFVQRWTGTWTFNFLLLTCASRRCAWTQWHWLLRLRRMLGLFTFFYATLHFLSFIGF